MAEEIDTDKLLTTVESLTKENEELKKQSEELAKVREKMEADKKKELIEKLVERTGKDIKEFESKSVEVLTELLNFLPDKVKPQAKGISEAVKPKEMVVEKDIIQILENGEMTMANNYWYEYDKNVRNLDWIDTKVVWRPNTPKAE